LLVTCHGYGGAVDQERIRRLSAFGLNVVGVDIRGFGLSRDAVPGLSPYGYVMTGHESKETSILRGAVCDYIQAYRAAEDWFGPASRVTFQGFSFAGGLALMASAALAMAHEGKVPGAPAPPTVVAAGAATFGHLRKRAELCQSGSGKEVATYLGMHPEDAERVVEVLSYYDACHFAPHLRLDQDGPVKRIIAGVGLYDPVVPPETVFSILNALPQPCELIELPCSHTERPEEAEWVRWEGTWIRAASRKLDRPRRKSMRPPSAAKQTI
jgi:cephalosporin-C deacetylase